jgi:hypothetical protein
MEKRRQPEIIAGRVNADGSIAAGDGFTVSKTGTGSYGIAFASSFRVVSASASVSTGGNLIFPFGFGSSNFAVSTTTAAGAAADVQFSFVAAGVQT